MVSRACPLTILWVLGITNAFNLIDGLDGLAAGSSLSPLWWFLPSALVSHTYLVSIVTLILAGAILGFLRFNFNPATIFLGAAALSLHRIHAQRSGLAGNAEAHRRRLSLLPFQLCRSGSPT